MEIWQILDVNGLGEINESSTDCIDELDVADPAEVND